MSQPPTSPSRKPSRSPLEWLVAFLSSFGLATVTLILLLVVVLLGTFDQVENGLFASQNKYFDSFFIVDQFKVKDSTIPFALPGGYLLMILLTINIVLGALRKIRKTPSKIGILIAHFAIILILLAGAVSLYFKKDGNLALFEGQTSDEFQSYHDSVIEIEQVQPAPADGKRKALVISGDEYRDLDSGKARVFTSKDLPFDLSVMNYMENCTPHVLKPGEAKKWPVDNIYLQPLTSEKDQEVNLDGAVVKVVDKKTGQEQTGLLWRGEEAPFAFNVGNELYNIRIGRRAWQLPFAVRLEKFEREVHPGTNQPRKFASRVTKITKGYEEKKNITMNAPLRDSGYVLFQASFSQSQMGETSRVRSVFAVVQNPSDQWPLYGLLAAAAGLLVHLIIRLIAFLKRVNAKPPVRSPASILPPPLP